jgi:NTE family protein
MELKNLLAQNEGEVRKIGLALSGGSVRGIAHIGVLKALSEAGIQPAIIAGTSVGSLIGAAIAAGLKWPDLLKMARDVFWPELLNGKRLERFCARWLPATFADLQFPFAAIATTVPERQTVVLRSGNLAAAISASCAIRGIRRPVSLNGDRLKDGGMSCVLPSVVCRQMGAEFVIGSDVWELSALLRGVGVAPTHSHASRFYPRQYMIALRDTDVLVQTSVPLIGYLPGPGSIDRLVSAGEAAVHNVDLGMLYHSGNSVC